MRAQEFISLMEYINKDVMSLGFSDEQSILDNKFIIKAETIAGSGPDFAGISLPKFKMLAIEVVDAQNPEKVVATAKFKIHGALWWKNLQAKMINVVPDYRRQGIATAVYQYVSKLGNTIKPSNVQLPPGQEMWKGFDRKHSLDEQSMAEDAFYGIEITLQDLGDDMIQIEAHAAGRELGYVTFVQEGDTLLPQDLHVDERYRGQGIAAAMYDYAKSRGYKIRRSGQQTDAGAGFWAKHRPEQNVWETVNRKGFERGFEQTKPYGDYTLRATPGYMAYIPGRVSRVSNFFRIEAYLGKSMVAWVNFEDRDGHLEAMDVHVEPRHRRKGIASAMYDFAKDIGNTIKPSHKQTALGREFSRHYNKPDVAKNTIESVDVDAIHAAALREHLLLNPTVLEGRDDTNRIKSFLHLHSTPKPHVGNQYVYASVQITPLADYVNIAHFGSQHQLIDLTHDHAYFDIDGTTKRFPEKGSLSGDALSRIYFFDSKKEFDQFAIMLSLKLSDYKHSSQLLDEPAMTENFADGKNPQDRGDSARHGIPRHATIAQLEKIRSSKTASPRKKQLAHWQINMRRGRAKSRK